MRASMIRESIDSFKTKGIIHGYTRPILNDFLPYSGKFRWGFELEFLHPHQNADFLKKLLEEVSGHRVQGPFNMRSTRTWRLETDLSLESDKFTNYGCFEAISPVFGPVQGMSVLVDVANALALSGAQFPACAGCHVNVSTPDIDRLDPLDLAYRLSGGWENHHRSLHGRNTAEARKYAQSLSESLHEALHPIGLLGSADDRRRLALDSFVKRQTINFYGFQERARHALPQRLELRIPSALTAVQRPQAFARTVLEFTDHLIQSLENPHPAQTVDNWLMRLSQ